MNDIFNKLFATNFMPHGHCYRWEPLILWTNVLSDLSIALAYYSIAFSLFLVVKGRSGILYHRMFILFSAFIFLCGTTHIFDLITVWNSYYGVQGIVKLITAVVSVLTAVLLWPQVLKYKQVILPDEKSLKEKLLQSLAEQDALKQTQTELQARVLERTNELKRANQDLLWMGNTLRDSYDAIITRDLDGTILSWNRGAAETFGYSAEEAIGSSIDILVPKNVSSMKGDGPNSEEINKRLISGEKFVDFEAAKQKKDGTVIEVSITKTPVWDEHGGLKAVSLIARDITHRKEIQNKLLRSVEEKEILLREIHHRVKNNLQVISSLLRLQSQHLADPIGKRMFQVSEERVRAIALVHEKLLKSEHLNKVDFKSYLGDLVHNLFSSNAVNPGRVQLALSADNIEIDIEKAVPCGLILNELVSNAFKHAFKARGEGSLSVELKSENGIATMTVADDGSGLPSEIDLKNPKTLGLQVVMILCRQLSAELHFETTEKGTRFVVSFPMGDKEKKAKLQEELLRRPAA